MLTTSVIIVLENKKFIGNSRLTTGSYNRKKKKQLGEIIECFVTKKPCIILSQVSREKRNVNNASACKSRALGLI